MINRSLIRTRAVQALYSYCHRGEKSLKETLASFDVSLKRTYDLYLYLIDLIPALTEKESELVEIRKNKHLATAEERNPNLRFVNNLLSKMINDSVLISEWSDTNAFSWVGKDNLMRSFLNEIYTTDFFHKYMNSDYSISNDVEFFCEVLKKVVFDHPDLAEYLEETSIYWDNELNHTEKIESENGLDDIEKLDEVIALAKENNLYSTHKLLGASVEIVKDFVLKTLRKLPNFTSVDDVVMPMYKDQEDERFALHLIRQSIVGYDEYSELVEQNISDQWETDRLPDLDLCIMILAITELIHFPSIPISVTINEYVELAKYYSTPKSGIFVNAVVDTIAKKLQEQKRIFK